MRPVPPMPATIRIATRGSQLARRQSEWVAAQLEQISDAVVEIIEITTRGDVQQQGPVADIGSTGVFTKEIQAAVLDGRAEVAVHSLKDLPTESVAGLALAATPSREDPSDALVARSGTLFSELPPGARIGTGSLRRLAQLRLLRNDVEFVGIRGNVDTRLRKLDAGEFDAIVLAAAGLQRLGLESRITERLSPPRILPAPGQGALAIECRAADSAILALLAKLDDRNTRVAVIAERSVLTTLRGGCSAPIGAWGRVVAGRLLVDAIVCDSAGSRAVKSTGEVELKDATADFLLAEDLGRSIARDLFSRGAAELLDGRY